MIEQTKKYIVDPRVLAQLDELVVVVDSSGQLWQIRLDAVAPQCIPVEVKPDA